MDGLRERVKSYFARPLSSSGDGAQESSRQQRSSSSPGRHRPVSTAAGRAEPGDTDSALAYLDSGNHPHRPPQLFGESVTGASPSAHSHLSGTGTDPDAAAAAASDPAFRFAPDETVRIRMLPYNPFFPIIEKDMTNGGSLTIGRYQRHMPADDPYNEGIYFRSTVVSRRHAVLTFINGEFFIKDVKSLGGTFLNSVRLSAAGKESKPVKVSHGDDLQFGVDYRPDARTGQVRNKDRCVELRVEFPKLVRKKKMPRPARWKPAEHTHTECCICLSALYIKQALFIAPCQHTFHYRCIAPLLRGKGFSCPMCRTNSDLHASLFSLDSAMEDEEYKADNSEGHVAVSPSESAPPGMRLVVDSAGDGNNDYNRNGDDSDDYDDGADPAVMATTPSDRRFSLPSSLNNNNDIRNQRNLNVDDPEPSTFEEELAFAQNSETVGHNTARNSWLPGSASPLAHELALAGDAAVADMAIARLDRLAISRRGAGEGVMEQGPTSGASDESFASRPTTDYGMPSTERVATDEDDGHDGQSQPLLTTSGGDIGTRSIFAATDPGETIVVIGQRASNTDHTHAGSQVSPSSHDSSPRVLKVDENDPGSTAVPGAEISSQEDQ